MGEGVYNFLAICCLSSSIAKQLLVFFTYLSTALRPKPTGLAEALFSQFPIILTQIYLYL